MQLRGNSWFPIRVDESGQAIIHYEWQRLFIRNPTLSIIAFFFNFITKDLWRIAFAHLGAERLCIRE